MSDSFVVVVPHDPRHVPSAEHQKALINLLRELAPTADEISSEVFDDVTFVDCGSNFESISCPACQASIDLDWWQDRMSEDFDGRGFSLKKYQSPCCATSVDLNELSYDWPQAFARFSCELRNPALGHFGETVLVRLRAAAGVPIRLVNRRL
jgi:hypothetical protein